MPVIAQPAPFYPAITRETASRLNQIATIEVAGWNIQYSFNTSGDLLLISYGGDSTQEIPEYKDHAMLWSLNSQSKLWEIEDQLVIFTPEGEQIVAGDSVGMIHILDAYTGEETDQFPIADSEITGLAFSPDDELLAIGDINGMVYLWDIADHSLIFSHLYEGDHPEPITNLIFSPSGRYLLADQNPVLSVTYYAFVWDLQTHELVAKISKASRLTATTEYLFSPDETLLAISGEKMTGATSTGIIRLYDLKSGSQVAALGGVWIREEFPQETWGSATPYFAPNPHFGTVEKIRFTEDGRYLVSMSRDTVRVWDIALAIQHGIGITTPAVDGINECLFDFTPPGASEVAACCRPPRWNIRDAAFHPTQPLIAFGDHETNVYLLSFADLSNLNPQLLTGHEHRVSELVFNSDGSLLVSMDGAGNIRFWEGITGRFITEYDNELSGFVDLAFSPDDRFLVSVKRFEGFGVYIWGIQE